MYQQRNTSPAPARESYVTREAYVPTNFTKVVEGKGAPQLQVTTRDIFRRFFTTRPWTLNTALTYIGAGGRFDFESPVDFESQATRTAAREAQDIRDWLLSKESRNAA